MLLCCQSWRLLWVFILIVGVINFLVHVMLLVFLVTPHSFVQRSKGPGSHLSIASYNLRGELRLEVRIRSSLRDLTWVLWDGAEIGLWNYFPSCLTLSRKNSVLFLGQSLGDVESLAWGTPEPAHRLVVVGGLVFICTPLQAETLKL